jgi:hypothetical protein
MKRHPTLDLRTDRRRRRGVESAVAKLLTKNQQDKVFRWLLDGMTYPRVSARIEAEFGKKISKGCLYGYWTNHWSRQLAEKAPAATASSVILEIVIQIRSSGGVAITKGGNPS